MANVGKSPRRAARWLCRFARLWGTLAAAFWLFVGVLATLGGGEPWTTESSVMAVLVAGSTLGVIVGWWRAGLGGLILVIVAVAHASFAYVAAGHSKAFAMLISGGAVPGGWCPLPGVLALLAHGQDARKLSR